MASLALGAVGAGIGGMFGFASIGWSIGSFIGGQLFGPKGQDIEGPRLTDRSVSTSAYGNMRPVIYGSYRMGGEVIWSTDIKEHKHKEKAGKGGVGGGSYTTYTYTVSFAVALCRGPITGVRKIWLDSKLVYSLADDASGAELQASGNVAKGIAIYTGSTTQTADPTMESYLGAGNVPGYRGTAYIVFTDLDVTKIRHLPIVTVGVVVNGTKSLTADINTAPNTATQQSLNIDNGVAKVFWSGYTYGSYADRAKFEQRYISLADKTLKKTKKVNFTPLGTGRPAYPVAISPDGKYVISQYDSTDTNNFPYLAVSGSDLMGYVVLTTDTNLFNDNNGAGDPSRMLRWGDDSSTIYFYKRNSGQLYIWVKTINPVYATAAWVLDKKIQVDSTRTGIDPIPGDISAIAIDRGNGDIYIGVQEYPSANLSVTRIGADGEILESGKFSGIDMFHGFSVSNGRLWLADPGGQDIKVYDWTTEALIDSTQISSWNNIGWCLEASDNICVGAIFGEIFIFKLALARNNVALSEVVSDICVSAGIDVSDIDVTDLASDVVRGFMISQQGPARGALEQLSAAFFFDGRESDGVLEFVKRGDTPTITLEDDDLGCYEGTDVQELWQAERTQEEELPKALTINYANQDADYQIGAQHSLRQSVLNGTEATIQLPIALTDTEAKKIIDTMMFTAWQNRHKFTLRTWQSFNRIEPADVISAAGETLRIVSRDEGVNGILELVGVRELPAIYTGQVGTAAESGYTNQSVTVNGPTDSLLLDLPPLRDDDYASYGVYWAANGLLDDWAGAVLLRSDDGDTWSSEVTVDVGAAIGQATTVLGNWTGGNVFDESNVVRVQVVGTLETKTEIEVLNGGNLAVLGDEVLQFKTASLVSSGVYDLSGLLRGRLGTEWAMDAHALDERFALLETDSTRFVDIPTADFNVSRDWGVITFGNTIEDIDQTTLTYAGNNLKPFPPVQIGGGATNYNTDWTINWVRRSRYNWQWLDYFDVGADEASYDFQVAILNGGSTVRTISVTGAQTTTYTAAQQLTDFGTWQPTLSVQIRQVGAIKNSEWTDPVTINSGYTSSSVLLMHFDGANGSTTFTDVYGHVVTGFGNAQISTAQSKFGGSSCKFDGTGDYLTTPNKPEFALETLATWTVECWVYRLASGARHGICGNRSAAGTDGWGFMIYTTDKLNMYFTGGSSVVSSGSISINTWTHVAAVRSAGTCKLYINGVQDGSASFSNGTASAALLAIGSEDNSYANVMNGYIEELRITYGAARYISNFTPPAAPFTE